MTKNLNVKKQYLLQNQELFGSDIFLDLNQKFPSSKIQIKNSKTVIIDDTWYYALEDEFSKDYWKSLTTDIHHLYKKKKIYPHAKKIFNAFDSTPLDKVKVVIIGQDPYHGPGQAHGLCFSVEKDTKIPPSLKNIYKELSSDLNVAISDSGNLQSWANQGVLLLNRVLTVEANKANSHKGLGWEKFTEAVIKVLSNDLKNVVFMLWGNEAKSFSSILDKNVHCVLSASHPSPLSANNGFFGCKHFSKANDYLIKNGKTPINWDISQ